MINDVGIKFATLSNAISNSEINTFIAVPIWFRKVRQTQDCDEKKQYGEEGRWLG